MEMREKTFFTEEQLVYIRDLFGDMIGRTENAHDELGIINVCQRLLGCPEYESYEQWQRDVSNTWNEIVEEEEE